MSKPMTRKQIEEHRAFVRKYANLWVERDGREQAAKKVWNIFGYICEVKDERLNVYGKDKVQAPLHLLFSL